MKVFYKQLFVVPLVILIACFPMNQSVSAIVRRDTQDRLGEFSQNRVFFYDSNCEDGTNESNQTCVVPSGDQITWIGDSLTAFGGQARLEQFFPGVDYGETFDGITVNDYVRSGKKISIGDSLGGAGGLDILQHIVDQGKLRSYLVFALGANSTWDTCTYDGVSCMEKLMELAGSSQVIVLTTKVIEPNDAADGGYDGNNDYLKEQAEKYDNLTILDWAEEVKDEYYIDDGLHYTEDGYDAYLQFIKDNLPKNCSAGLLPGDNNAEKIWNYFVQAGIKGVSDNPAVIAGILGNLQIESAGTLDPFCNGSGGDCSVGDSSYYGLHAESNPSMKQAVDDAGYEQYWSKGDSAPAEVVNEAIRIELDWMVKNNPRWVGGCTDAGCWSAEAAFITNLDNVSDTGSPESYSDLFLVTVEGAYPGGSTAIEDSGVQAIASSMGWGSDLWQMATERRAAAGDYYDEYAGTGATPSGSTSGFSATNTLSGTGNQAYTATNEEKMKLLRFSIWEAGQNDEDYKDVLSSILDDFEKNNNDKKGDTDSLIKYVEEGDEFKYRKEYDQYSTLSVVITTTPEQEQDAQDIINDGLRTTLAGRAQITNGKELGVNYCSGGSNRGIGAARIAEVAALMSWPVQNTQTNAEDYQSGREGRCESSSGQWVDYKSNRAACVTNPRELYRNNLRGYSYIDCGVFVGSVLYYLGVVGDDFVNYGQPGAGTYFRSHPEDWEEITNTGSESIMKPGDILWENGTRSSHGHIIVYVGEEYGGDWGTIAHASVPYSDYPNGRVGEVTGIYDVGDWYIFRYIGNKLGTAETGEPITSASEAETVWNSLGNITYEDVKEVAANYGIDENGLLAILAWTENEAYVSEAFYELRGERYSGYLSACVMIDRLLEQHNNDAASLINEIKNYPAIGGGDYGQRVIDMGKNPSQNTLKAVYMALTHLYTGLTVCSGVENPEGKYVWQTRGFDGSPSYVW